ncbi:MAG TPA: hypothetical protein VG097_16435, partial [Gemmata sp.]|nr:hypothetical protein [Gemmata sp.]
MIGFLTSLVYQPLRVLGHAIAYYPLLLPAPLLLHVICWNAVVTDYDAFHVLWNPHPWAGIFSGIGVALILGWSLLAVFLLDQAPWTPPHPLPPRSQGKVKHSKQTEVKHDGSSPVPLEAYWFVWGVELVLIVLPAFFPSPFFKDTPPPFQLNHNVVNASAFTMPEFTREEFVQSGEDPEDFLTEQSRMTLARIWFPFGVLVTAVFFGVLRWRVPTMWENLNHLREFAAWLIALSTMHYLLMFLAHLFLGHRAADDPWAARWWVRSVLGVLCISVLGFAVWRVRATNHDRRVAMFWVALVFSTLLVLSAGFVSLSGTSYCTASRAPVALLGSLGMLTGFLALVTWWSRQGTWWVSAVVGLLIVPFLFSSCQREYQVPNLDAYYSNPRNLERYEDFRADCKLTDRSFTALRDAKVPEPVLSKLTPLKDRGFSQKALVEEINKVLNTDDKNQFRQLILKHADSRKEEENQGGMILDETPISAFDPRLSAHRCKTRPLVVVAVSGGASASAVYTADILFTLEMQHPGFIDQVRVITGASGGMLGAAYFVTAFREGTPLALAREDHRKGVLGVVEYSNMLKKARHTALEDLGQDFLGPIVQRWVYHDAPLYLLPQGTTNDRGRALEQGWQGMKGYQRHSPEGVLNLSFHDLRKDEIEGRIPSLIFSPMMIEDGRQLLISNLNLNYMVDSWIPDNDCGCWQDGEQNLAHTALEFYRLFPDSRPTFQLSTAVRLNASFPFFSPSAALPTSPPRHVVDAGYFDNYGTLTATKWIYRNASPIHKKLNYSVPGKDPERRDTSPAEIVLLQIRCFGFEREATGYVRLAEIGGKKAPPAALYSLVAPIIGALESRRANMVYRGEERMNAVNQLLRESNLSSYERVLIECEIGPSLNWTLTPDSLRLLRRDVWAKLEGD